MIEINIVKVLVPWLFSFLLGFVLAPWVIFYLNKFKTWKKKSGNEKGLGDDNGTPIFNKLHKEKDINTPRMGGVLIVLAVFFIVSFFWVASYISTGTPSGKFDFLSRDQTWLVLFTFLFGATLGFFDDLFTIKREGFMAGGLPIRIRLSLVAFFGFFASLWFYYNLGYDFVHIPFYGDIILGWLFIPFFIAVFMAVFATSNIDGLDGLSGGIMAIVFTAYGFISFFLDKLNIAAFCFVIVGAVLSFLWFNIPPAKFYMTEVGYNALSLTLATVAFLTDTVLLLPIIAFPLFATLVTTVLQILSKKIRGKKIFLVAPIHHHFEAIGWPAYKVVMRYWIVTLLFAILGAILALIS